MERVAVVIEELFELYPDKQFFYVHKDHKVGFSERGRVVWYIYSSKECGYVRLGETDHPEGATLTKIKREKSSKSGHSS